MISSSNVGATASPRALATPQAPTQATGAASNPIPGVTHHSICNNGLTLHYVEAGEGEAVLLLPGWPQNWYAWRAMIPLLVAQHRRVIVLDPRGFGDSDKPPAGYDLDTAAADVHGFIASVGIQRPGGIDVVSHDLGSWIGYALASNYPDDVRRLVLSEVTIPDPGSSKAIPDDGANVKTWHFGFNRLIDLPDILVESHERAFLDWLFDNKAERPWMIDKTARDEYVRAFSLPGAAHAGFAYYQKLFSATGLKRISERLAKALRMPVLTVGTDGGVGELLNQSLTGSALNMQGTILTDCGHYLPEECPAKFAEAIAHFWHLTATEVH